MCWYPVPVSVPVNVIRQLPLGRGRLHKAIRHQLLCCAEGRARTHPRLPNVGFRHTGFSETELPEMPILGNRVAAFGRSRKLGDAKRAGAVRPWPSPEAALLGGLYALPLVLTYIHTPTFSNRYSNTSNASHAPSLHSSSFSLVVGRQPLPWSP